MLSAIRTLVNKPFALRWAVWLTVAASVCCSAVELTPESYAEWARRSSGVNDAAQQAKKGAIAPLLQWLVLELADPIPADLPAAGSNFTLSEQIQSMAVHGLVEPNDPAQVRHAYRAAQALEKQMVLAMGLGGIADVDEQKPGHEVLDRCLALVANDPSDFIRARAADALGRIGLAHPELIPRLEEPLRKGLDDPSWRPNRTTTAGPGAAKYYPVRAEARSALVHLGFHLGLEEGVQYSD